MRALIQFDAIDGAGAFAIRTHPADAAHLHGLQRAVCGDTDLVVLSSRPPAVHRRVVLLAVNSSFTGAPASLARTAAIRSKSWFWFLLPKPPPMYWQTTWMCSSFMARSFAMCVRQFEIPCVDAYNIRLPPSHVATLTRRSSCALLMYAVLYLSSKTWVDALRPCSISPRR